MASEAHAPSCSDPAVEKLRAWLEKSLGGRVRRLERQARWRPAWWADLERDGETLALVVRGDRTDVPGVFPLEHEMRLQQQLDAHGIPVARVHGWCDDPRAFAIARVPGENHFQGASEAERRSVMDDYMAILARLHALDPQPFAEAGIARARTPQESGLVGMAAYERSYRRAKRRPDPFLEFFLGWLARHPLDNRGRESVIVWDSGQFQHAGGRIAALLDLEIGHIGDPMMDLAGLRMRDTVIGYGDLRALYDRYAEHRGEPVDLAAVQYYHLAFTLSNQLAYHTALADPPAESDYMTNLQWCSETNLFAVEALAEILDVALGGVEMHEPRVSPVAVAHAQLVRSLTSIEAADEFGRYQLRSAFRLARHLQRFDEIGDALVAADLDDLHRLLGRRPASWQEGDAELERFVLADAGRRDLDLLHLFHRRYLRYKMLLGPAGSAMATHHAIQRFSDAR
jgi:aminoglycoside phosphotransferase (APT) family kinase protein